ATLEERLKSRFEWGLTADVVAPEFETRIAIIKRKAEMLEIDLPNNVCEFIAMKLKSNIRSLEGVVKKMKAHLLLEGKSPSIITAQNAISDIARDDEPTPITVDKILEEVSRTFGCTKEDIISTKRNAKISKARQVSSYIVREVTQMPMSTIGEMLGGRDHSTIVYSINQVEEKIKKDPSMRATVEDITKNIKNL
ncbi:MAG: helix-turn-helix domain-containing protein, partial [Clostridia bacterium]